MEEFDWKNVIKLEKALKELHFFFLHGSVWNLAWKAKREIDSYTNISREKLDEKKKLEMW